VEEYTREFEQLLLKCDLKNDETQTFVRYLSGLDDQIAYVIEVHPYSFLDDLSSLAYKVEQQRKGKGKSALSKPYTGPYPFERPSNTFPKPQNTLSPWSTPPTAQNSSQRTHPKAEDKRRRSWCQGLGHIASECPNKRIVTLAEYQASLEEFEEKEEGVKEVCLNEPIEEVKEGLDEGDLLVIRRALSGLVSQDEFDQRETIFHTRCTASGKVCSLIIDAGICVNFTPQSMVDNLKLLITPHPKPYTIQWFNQSKGLQISTQCLLSLSIGKTYKDEICCDIVPMDACHVLLGRPWLFDRRVMHDGRMDTYTFTKDHKKITLTPLKSSFPSKPKENPKMDVFLTTLLKSQMHEFEPYKEWILLGQDSAIAIASHHPLLTLLLRAFQHVFP